MTTVFDISINAIIVTKSIVSVNSSTDKLKAITTVHVNVMKNIMTSIIKYNELAALKWKFANGNVKMKGLERRKGR